MENSRMQMNDFFISVQLKALKQVEFGIGDRDEALDLVQEAMIRLAKKYSDKPNDWPKLFQRILQNLIRDYHRRKKVRSILVWWNQSDKESASVEEALSNEIEEVAPSVGHRPPECMRSGEQVAERILHALKELPIRQQQAFTLRAWWGHDVKETAFAMECSEGSVKTHYSRALARLRELLGDHEI